MSDAFGRGLAKADQWLGWIEDQLNLLAGLLIFGLMLLGVVQIVLRTVVRAPIFGYIDIVEVSMVGFAVLAISYVQRLGGHVRMELLVGRLKGRTLWVAEAVGTAPAIFIVAVLIPYSYRHFERALNFGDSTIDIEIVTWPAKLVVPAALTILLGRLVLQLAGYVRLVIHPERDPVAVPLLAVPLLKEGEQAAAENIRETQDSVQRDRPDASHDENRP